MDDEENEQPALDELMATLRRNKNKIKSLDEISAEDMLHNQRDRGVLRSCMDQILIHMNDTNSLRDVIDRLRAVARTNSLRFSLPIDKDANKSETVCEISLLGDAFRVQIILGAGEKHSSKPSVVDAKVHHSDKVVSSPQLIEMVRSRKFLELSNYFKQLQQLYPTSMDDSGRRRLLIALQSLEVDTDKAFKIYKETQTNNGLDCSNTDLIRHGLFGFVGPRDVGKPTKIIYFVSPFELIDTEKKKLKTVEKVVDGLGLQGELRVVTHPTSCRLPISPLITHNCPSDASGMARYSDVNHNNSVCLPACFVFRLKPPMPMLGQIAIEIRQEIGIPVFTPDQKILTYLQMLLPEDKVSRTNVGTDTMTFHLEINKLYGSIVKEIRFNHPRQLVQIISLLRKQAFLNQLLSSCIKSPKDALESEVYFHVSICENLKGINIDFEHPLSPSSLAVATVKFSSEGYESCSLATGRGDPDLCNDAFLTKVLKSTFSLPLTMRRIIMKAKEKPDYKKDVERMKTITQPSTIQQQQGGGVRGSPASTVFHNQQQNTTQQQIQKQSPSTSGYKQQQQQQRGGGTTPSSQQSTFHTNQQQTVSMSSSAASTSDSSGAPAKVSQHPILSTLLLPNTEIQSSKPPPPAVQTQRHPMLLDLLNVSSPNTSSTASGGGGGPSATRLLAQSSPSQSNLTGKKQQQQPEMMQTDNHQQMIQQQQYQQQISNKLVSMSPAAYTDHQNTSIHGTPSPYMPSPADGYMVSPSPQHTTASQMPPPPSYKTAMQMQLKQQQQIMYQQQLTYPPHQSPANMEDIQSPLNTMPSPAHLYNPTQQQQQTNNPHQSPLLQHVGMMSPHPQQQTQQQSVAAHMSPMYAQSPKYPPMNTPQQPCAPSPQMVGGQMIASPLVSPAPAAVRHLSGNGGRRGSRQMSSSGEDGVFDFSHPLFGGVDLPEQNQYNPNDYLNIQGSNAKTQNMGSPAHMVRQQQSGQQQQQGGFQQQQQQNNGGQQQHIVLQHQKSTDNNRQLNFNPTSNSDTMTDRQQVFRRDSLSNPPYPSPGFPDSQDPHFPMASPMHPGSVPENTHQQQQQRQQQYSNMGQAVSQSQMMTNQQQQQIIQQSGFGNSQQQQQSIQKQQQLNQSNFNSEMMQQRKQQIQQQQLQNKNFDSQQQQGGYSKGGNNYQRSDSVGSDMSSKSTTTMSSLNTNQFSTTTTTISNQQQVDSNTPDADVFTFDDNRNPLKISMPESGSSSNNSSNGSITGSAHRTKSMQNNNTSTSKNTSFAGLTEATLKDLYQSSPGLMSVLTRVPSKTTSTQKQPTKTTPTNANKDVRKNSSSQDNSTHKQLIRQNALSKGGNGSGIQGKTAGTNSQSKSDTKAKKAKKEDKAPTRRRGRPPSTDTKSREFSVKRKKTDTGSSTPSEDSGRIVISKVSDSWTIKNKPTQPQTSQNDNIQQIASKNATASSSSFNFSSATSSTSGAQSNPAWIQDYVKSQSEMNMKKKEKKLAAGSNYGQQQLSSSNKSKSQVTGGPNSARGGQFSQQSQQNGSKSQQHISGNQQQKSNQPSSTSSMSSSSAAGFSSMQPQAKSATKSRKNSLKEVVDKLSNKQVTAEHVVVGAPISTNGPPKLDRQSPSLSSSSSRSSTPTQGHLHQRTLERSSSGAADFASATSSAVVGTTRGGKQTYNSNTSNIQVVNNGGGNKPQSNIKNPTISAGRPTINATVGNKTSVNPNIKSTTTRNSPILKATATTQQQINTRPTSAGSNNIVSTKSTSVGKMRPSSATIPRSLSKSPTIASGNKSSPATTIGGCKNHVTTSTGGGVFNKKNDPPATNPRNQVNGAIMTSSTSDVIIGQQRQQQRTKPMTSPHNRVLTSSSSFKEGQLHSLLMEPVEKSNSIPPRIPTPTNHQQKKSSPSFPQDFNKKHLNNTDTQQQQMIYTASSSGSDKQHSSSEHLMTNDGTNTPPVPSSSDTTNSNYQRVVSFHHKFSSSKSELPSTSSSSANFQTLSSSATAANLSEKNDLLLSLFDDPL